MTFFVRPERNPRLFSGDGNHMPDQTESPTEREPLVEKPQREAATSWLCGFSSFWNSIKRLLRDPVWQGIAGIVAIAAFAITLWQILSAATNGPNTRLTTLPTATIVGVQFVPTNSRLQIPLLRCTPIQRRSLLSHRSRKAGRQIQYQLLRLDPRCGQCQLPPLLSLLRRAQLVHQPQLHLRQL